MQFRQLLSTFQRTGGVTSGNHVARSAGLRFEIDLPTDPCGDVAAKAHERAVGRLVQSGAVPVTSLQVVFELQQDWSRRWSYR